MANKTFAFGVGTVYADDIEIGVVQNVSLDISASIKELYGANIFPEAIGVGTHKVSGSAAFAGLNNELLPKFFFGTEMQSGNILRQEEGAAVPASTPYTVTVSEAANYYQNIAVINAATGQHFKLVTSSPSAGQYQVNVATGEYTFSAADASASVIIRYDTEETTGQHFVMRNRRMGQQTPFTLVLANEFQGKRYAVTLYQCVFTKSAYAFKNDDFAVPNVDFSCFTNDAQLIGRMDFQDLS